MGFGAGVFLRLAWCLACWAEAAFCRASLSSVTAGGGPSCAGLEEATIRSACSSRTEMAGRIAPATNSETPDRSHPRGRSSYVAA